MDSEIVTLAGTIAFFAEDLDVIRKAELKIKSNHVLHMAMKDLDINAKVRASMKDKTYSVIVTVDGSGGISCAKCECPRGNWICSHMATVAIYANKVGLSKTDLPNSWIQQPRKANKENIKTMQSLFPPTKANFTAVSRRVNSEDCTFVQSRLVDSKLACPMLWITGPDPVDKTALCCGNVANICDLFPTFQTDKAEFLKRCQVDGRVIEKVSNETKLQRMSHQWGKIRKYRLTGSNFGLVLNAFDRHNSTGTYPPSLYKTLCGEYNLSCKNAILWGQMHEEAASSAYQKLTGNTVEKTGFRLFACGYLGCSPDGLITTQDGRRGVLEIKCPWKYRDNTFAEIMEQEFKGRDVAPNFYLDKTTALNRKHSYWHQIQGEIASANVDWGHFVIWTKQDVKVLQVNRDRNWATTNLPKLTEFYMNHFLPHVTATKTSPKINVHILMSD